MKPKKVTKKGARQRALVLILVWMSFSGLLLVGLGITANGQTLYWRSDMGTWTTTMGPGNNNWSTASGSTGSLPWTNGDDAVIETFNPTITVGDDTLNLASLATPNGATLTGTFTTLRTISVAGAGSGNLTLDGSHLGTNGRLELDLNTTTAANAWNGTLTLSGVPTAEAATVLINSVNAVSKATFLNLDKGGTIVLGANIAGATVTVGSLSGTGILTPSSPTEISGATKTLRVEQSSDTIFTGITDLGDGVSTLAFIKAGSGTLVFGAGATIYHFGGTTVEAGVLIMDATNTLNQTIWTVKSGATLGGNGLIKLYSGSGRIVTVESGGILAPGDVSLPGTLSISGATTTSKTTGPGLDFAGNATIKFRLGTPVTEQDRISLSNFQTSPASGGGSAEGGFGSIQISLTNFNGDARTGPYDLIDFATAPIIPISDFALATDSIAAGWAGMFLYNGNTLRLIVTAVPEPSGASLVLLGAVAVISGRRRGHQMPACPRKIEAV
jgi:autotransporter-associated beta strand protein